jgi:hypothetical protein
VPGNAGPGPGDDRGLPPHPASTTMTAPATRADRRHRAVADRGQPMTLTTPDNSHRPDSRAFPP